MAFVACVSIHLDSLDMADGAGWNVGNCFQMSTCCSTDVSNVNRVEGDLATFLFFCVSTVMSNILSPPFQQQSPIA